MRRTYTSVSPTPSSLTSSSTRVSPPPLATAGVRWALSCVARCRASTVFRLRSLSLQIVDEVSGKNIVEIREEYESSSEDEQATQAEQAPVRRGEQRLRLAASPKGLQGRKAS